MKSDIYIARAYGEKQAVDAIRKDKFDISFTESPIGDDTHIYCNSDEMWDMLKRLFATEQGHTYASDLAMVIVEMSPDEVENRLRSVFP